MLETAVKYSAFHSGLCLIIDDTPLLPQPPTDGGRVQTFSKVAYWIRKCISMWQFANLYLLDLVIHLLYCFHSTYQLRIFITFLLSFVHDLHSLFFIHHSASPSARLLVFFPGGCHRPNQAVNDIVHAVLFKLDSEGNKYTICNRS